MSDEEEPSFNLEGWKEHLEEFDKTVYPLFKEFGYSKNTALQVYMSNTLFNKIDRLINEMRDYMALPDDLDDDDDDQAWQGSGGIL